MLCTSSPPPPQILHNSWLSTCTIIRLLCSGCDTYVNIHVYVRVAVSNTDCDNPSEEVEVATPSVIIQPLHVALKNNYYNQERKQHTNMYTQKLMYMCSLIFVPSLLGIKYPCISGCIMKISPFAIVATFAVSNIAISLGMRLGFNWRHCHRLKSN